MQKKKMFEVAYKFEQLHQKKLLIIHCNLEFSPKNIYLKKNCRSWMNTLT